MALGGGGGAGGGGGGGGGEMGGPLIGVCPPPPPPPKMGHIIDSASHATNKWLVNINSSSLPVHSV